MSFIPTRNHHLVKNPISRFSKSRNCINHFNFNSVATHSLSFSPSTRLNSVHTRVNSLPPKFLFRNQPFEENKPVQELLFLFIFSLTLLLLRLFSNALLPNFSLRWRSLVAFSQLNEPKTRDYPSHLWQAVVAYEDKRFFSHFGVDPVGIARAVWSLSALGGGSTITQQLTWQLVKNTFLKNERTVSRKIGEMMLALAMERAMSKWEILSSYVSKIYFGHGIYGIESASIFYFGKHPSLLSLGESAMLAGLIPAPQLRSPIMDSSRGKTFQARVLKRMVEVGFINVDTALSVLKEPLHLRLDELKYTDPLLYLLSFSGKGFKGFNKLNQGSIDSIMKDVWEWEKESKIWEACEDMERWAAEFLQRCSTKISV